MMPDNTALVCAKPLQSSRLVVDENLNDHAAEDPM